jgi:hypothetical protein
VETDDRPTLDEVEITPEMVEAGVSALEDGFLCEDYLSPTVLPQAVRRVFLAMQAARMPRSTGASPRPYVEREDFTVTLDRIAALLDGGSVDLELAEATRALFKRHPFEFFRCVVGGCQAVRVGAQQVGQSGPRTEPTDFTLRLVAALAANDRDEFFIVAQEIAPWLGLATPG